MIIYNIAPKTLKVRVLLYQISKMQEILTSRKYYFPNSSLFHFILLFLKIAILLTFLGETLLEIYWEINHYDP